MAGLLPLWEKSDLVTQTNVIIWKVKFDITLKPCYKYIIYDEKGAKVYITQIKSGNGILSSLLNANCLIEIEKGNEGLNRGEVVNIIKL